MAFDINKGLIYVHGINGTVYGGYAFPLKYIKFDSYKVLYSVTDLDSYRDQSGKLQRNALAHRPIKVEFETPAMLDNDEFGSLMAELQARYTIPAEKKLVIDVFVAEINDYLVSQEVYIPDLNIQMYRYNKAMGKLQYDPVRFAFIGY